jgi:hypothetical protein
MEAGAGEGVGAGPSPLVPPPPHISALRAASSTTALISCSTEKRENKISTVQQKRERTNLVGTVQQKRERTK